MADRRHQLERQLFRTLKSTCDRYGLLAAGDHVMVAISGGKDSYTLLHLLHQLVRSLPFEVALTAVHLDQRQPGYDGRPLVEWLERSGYAFEILAEDTYSVVVDRVAEGATYCSLCSRLRRGILYTAAERLGCNKIALGHHREDTLETFLMNLFFAGKLQAMPASYTTDDGKFEVIRPLIETPEAQIAEFAALMEFPILPCNLCGSQPGLQRDQMARLLESLEQSNPHLRSIMLNALRNVSATHLLDRRLSAPRQSSAADEQLGPPARRRIEHASALPVHASRPRLPLLPPDQ